MMLLMCAVHFTVYFVHGTGLGFDLLSVDARGEVWSGAHEAGAQHLLPQSDGEAECARDCARLAALREGVGGL